MRSHGFGFSSNPVRKNVAFAPFWSVRDHAICGVSDGSGPSSNVRYAVLPDPIAVADGVAFGEAVCVGVTELGLGL